MGLKVPNKRIGMIEDTRDILNEIKKIHLKHNKTNTYNHTPTTDIRI
jgi:hypothetical protein